MTNLSTIKLPVFDQLLLRACSEGVRSSTRAASRSPYTHYSQNGYFMNLHPTSATVVFEQHNRAWPVGSDEHAGTILLGGSELKQSVFASSVGPTIP